MDMETLLNLAKRGCTNGMSPISSSLLAEDLGSSQQTASRRIKELERKGYIEREILPKGQRIKITSKGTKLLKSTYLELKEVFEGRDKSHIFTIGGEVISGMGEGRYYMEIPGYMSQFKEKLGFTPYPGTLNIRLKTEEDLKIRQQLNEMEGIEIKGFDQENRTLGSARCFRAEIDSKKGAIVIPSRTHHSYTTIEFVSRINLRKELKLRDGDLITVKIFI